MIELHIPMKAVGKARARIVNKGGRTFSYTPKRTADAEKVIAAYAKAQGVKPLDGPISITMEFVFEPPESWSKKRKESALRQELLPAKKPDLDNLVKLCTDSLNGIAYLDDSQIVRLDATKRYGEENYIHVIALLI